MKQSSLSNYACLWLRSLNRKLQSAISWGAYLDTLVCVQEIALEDLEFYAIYDQNLFSIAFWIMIFKPIEYICELAVITVVKRRH